MRLVPVVHTQTQIIYKMQQYRIIYTLPAMTGQLLKYFVKTSVSTVADIKIRRSDRNLDKESRNAIRRKSEKQFRS